MLDVRYPSEEELLRIRTWPAAEGHELMDYVRERWGYADAGYWARSETPESVTYRLSTAGWSGNEDLVVALQENLLFWSMYWQSSRRNEHNEFIIPLQHAAEATL